MYGNKCEKHKRIGWFLNKLPKLTYEATENLNIPLGRGHTRWWGGEWRLNGTIEKASTAWWVYGLGLSRWRRNQLERIRLPTQEPQEMWVWSLGWGDPLEKKMATHSSILAWRIPWTEDPGRLQSRGSQRVGHYWAQQHSTRVCGQLASNLWKTRTVCSIII